MFTEKELREKGAKRAVLEYIAAEDPSIAIPETVDEKDIGEGVIVRSDHWREFDAFEGIFESVEVGRKFFDRRFNVVARLTDPKQIVDYMFFREVGEPNIDEDVRFKRDVFERYCVGKGLSPDKVMQEFSVYPQKKVNARFLGTILSHPHVPGRYLIHGKGVGSKGNYPVAFFVDKNKNGIKNIRGEEDTGKLSLDQLLSVSPISVPDVEKIISLYEQVHGLPKFQDGFVYMMEFTFDPTYVLQMRLFRKREEGTALECPWKNEKDVIKTDMAFGMTPPEGIVLPLYRESIFPGIPQRHPLVQELFDFAEEHSDGFAYISGEDQHTRVIIPSASASLAGNFCASFTHGTVANMASMPLYLCDVKRALYDRKDMFLHGCRIRLFSKGSEAYIIREQ